MPARADRGRGLPAQGIVEVDQGQVWRCKIASLDVRPPAEDLLAVPADPNAGSDAAICRVDAGDGDAVDGVERFVGSADGSHIVDGGMPRDLNDIFRGADHDDGHLLAAVVRCAQRLVTRYRVVVGTDTLAGGAWSEKPGRTQWAVMQSPDNQCRLLAGEIAGERDVPGCQWRLAVRVCPWKPADLIEEVRGVGEVPTGRQPQVSSMPLGLATGPNSCERCRAVIDSGMPMPTSSAARPAARTVNRRRSDF